MSTNYLNQQITDFNNPDSSWQQTAKNLLRQRLHNLRRLDNNRAFDETFLTCAEYQLFLDEMRLEGKYFQPDHWTDFRFANAEAFKPVTGVRASDASAFCHWLGTKTKTGLLVRLPTLEEAHQISAKNLDIATWCKDGNTYRLTGLNNRTAQALLQHLTPFAKTELPAFNITDLKRDLNAKIDQNLNVDLNKEKFPYENVYLENLWEALIPVLNLGGYPNKSHRLTELATNYQAAYASKIGSACKVSCMRNLNEDSNEGKYKFFVQNYGWRSAGFEEVTAAIEKNDLDEAQKLIKNLATSQDVIKVRWAAVLSDYLAITKAQNVVKLRQAYRSYSLHVAGFAYIGYSVADLVQNEYKKAKGVGGQLFWALRPHTLAKAISNKAFAVNSGRFSNEQQILKDFIWWLQITMARETGQLPAWEGIRVVCER